MQKKTIFMLAGLGALILLGKKGLGLGYDFYDSSPMQMDDSFTTGEGDPYAVEGSPSGIPEPGYGSPVYASQAGSAYWNQQQALRQQYFPQAGPGVTQNLTTPNSSYGINEYGQPDPSIPVGYKRVCTAPGYCQVVANPYATQQYNPYGTTQYNPYGTTQYNPYGTTSTVLPPYGYQQPLISPIATGAGYDPYTQSYSNVYPTNVIPGTQNNYLPITQQNQYAANCQSLLQDKRYGRTKCPPGFYKIAVGKGKARQLLCRPLNCTTNQTSPYAAAQAQLYGMDGLGAWTKGGGRAEIDNRRRTQTQVIKRPALTLYGR